MKLHNEHMGVINPAIAVCIRAISQPDMSHIIRICQNKLPVPMQFAFVNHDARPIKGLIWIRDQGL